MVIYCDVTWAEDSVSFLFRPTDDGLHFLQKDFLHQNKHWSNLIGEAANTYSHVFQTRYTIKDNRLWSNLGFNNFPRPYVPKTYSVFPRFYCVSTYIPKTLHSQASIFPRPYIPKPLYSPDSTLPRVYISKTLHSQDPMFLRPVFQRSYVSRTYIFKGPCPPNSVFPGPYVPRIYSSIAPIYFKYAMFWGLYTLGTLGNLLISCLRSWDH